MKALTHIAVDEEHERGALDTGPHTEAGRAPCDDLGFEPTTSYGSDVTGAVHDYWQFVELTLERDSERDSL